MPPHINVLMTVRDVGQKTSYCAALCTPLVALFDTCTTWIS